MVGALQNFHIQCIGFGNAVKGLALLHRVIHSLVGIGPRVELEALASCKEQEADEKNRFEIMIERHFMET